MREKLEKFTEEFFKNLKCDVSWTGDILKVENVPRSFEDLFGKKGPYKLSFVSDINGGHEFVGKGSLMFGAMLKYLEGAGKATLLRIDFSPRDDSGESDLDVEREIKKRIGFRNCELVSLSKKHRNNFFSRFSFATTFNYLNESERLISEVYVYDGKCVSGDLNGYTVVDGEGALRVDDKQIKRDFELAKKRAAELSFEKQEELSRLLKEKVDEETQRIKGHYNKQLKELGGDLNERLEKIRKLELDIRSCEDAERDVLMKRLERFRSGLVKAGDDEVARRVLKERDMTIRDAMHKLSLNIDRKLINTTVIYYPVYVLNLHLKSDSKGVSGKLLEIVYDPLQKKFSGLDCESCGRRLEKLSLCGEGHVCCEDCLDRCGECGKVFCVKCLKRSCSVCGRALCRDCAKMCLRCGRIVCATHLRRDGVSGEERCVGCLRACLRCHGMCEEKFFGEARDGSKVCSKCLGEEKRRRVLGRVFRE